MKKILTKFFLLSFFLLNLTFMAESKNQSLRIAAILPLSGDYEEIGKKILKTFELTIFELSNANISLLPFDNKSTKSGTKFAFQELQNQKIDIVIGPVFMENLLSITNDENFSKYIFISLSNNNITLPKNVISFGINIDSQIAALKLILKEDNVSFKEIVDSDIDILYKLLKSRKYSISHQKLPDYEQHKNFVLSKPYDYWYLLYSKNKPIGTLYVKSDNSVGINIENPSKELIGEVISFVKENFLPNPELESKIPPYFYINISKQNIEMQNILLGLSLEPIQISFKLN